MWKENSLDDPPTLQFKNTELHLESLCCKKKKPQVIQDGTPEVTSKLSDNAEFKKTLCVVLDRKSLCV